MTDIVATNDLFDLMSEFDIDIPGVNNIYENLYERRGQFTRIPNSRLLLSDWNEGVTATFHWNQPGKDKEDVEEFDEIPNVNYLGGYVLYSQIKPSLDKKGGEDNRPNSVCSVIGYKNPVSGEFIETPPDFYPIMQMYDGWDSVNNRPIRTNPNPLVERLGLVGSRGKLCADCIRCGESFIDNGNDKPDECTPYGRLFFWVTDLGRQKKVTNGNEVSYQLTTKSVKDITGEDGFLLIIPLPHKIAIKGVWDNKDPEKRRIGYARYLMGLPKSINRDPRFVYTSITIKPPLGTNQSRKNFLHFESKEVTNIDQCKKALAVWKDINPNKEVKVLDISTISSNSTKPKDAVSNKVNQLKSAEVIEEIEEDSPFD